jgi:hypothetical protein
MNITFSRDPLLRLYSQAANAHMQDDLVKTRKMLEKMLLIDASCPDALLGIYALDQEGKRDLLPKIAEAADRLGQQSDKSQYCIVGGYVPLLDKGALLKTPDSARCAAAHFYAETNEFQAAHSLLDECSHALLANTVRLAVFAYEERHEDALRLIQQETFPEEFVGEIQLVAGISLRNLGLLERAQESLSLAEENSSRYLSLMSRYEQALVSSALGKEKESLDLFESIYIEDVDFADVAERLNTSGSQSDSWRNADFEGIDFSRLANQNDRL